MEKPIQHIAITGAKGQLGKVLAPLLKDAGFVVSTFGSQELDITQALEVESTLAKQAFDVLINCAAYTNVSKAEEDFQRAKEVNQIGVGNLAASCAKHGCLLLHFSTDYVFDGKQQAAYREEDSCHPLNKYGLSKRLGEETLLNSNADYLLLRISWLVSRFEPNFLAFVRKKCLLQEAMKIVDDQVASPTTCEQLGADLVQIFRSHSLPALKAKKGLYHYAHQGETSWYGIAQAVRKAYPNVPEITPVLSSEFPSPVVRPAYSKLSPDLFHHTFFNKPVSWQAAIENTLSLMQPSTAAINSAHAWLNADIDQATKEEIKHLLAENPKELEESFYKELEFGTGGMRGIMGAGSNRINPYTLGLATQGLCNYMKTVFGDKPQSVAIAYDSRNNSPLFGRKVAEVFAANGIEAFLFDALRPTPLLSYAVRYLGCQAGIVITASHNPKEYNGYKVYWEDGAQIVSPQDKAIIAEVRKISSLNDIRWDADPALIKPVPADVENSYLEKVAALSLSPNAVKSDGDISIVYTSLHGTGITLLPKALEKAGFSQLHIVRPQDEPDGNFPTVESPNPEESAALGMALEIAESTGADLVLGTDPDTDRVGIAVRDASKQMVLLNGNQTGAMLMYYHLLRWKELGKLQGKEFVAKTVVTSDLIAEIAQHFGVLMDETLTGFKWIAARIREREGSHTFITGGEESYGYLSGDFVRDKDGVISSVMICEMAAWAKSQGMNLYGLLEKIHREFGLYEESLVSIVKKGKSGAEEISAMMDKYRNQPPKELAGTTVAEIKDLASGMATEMGSGEQRALHFPKSNVMQFVLEDGSKVTARPSGTEPKIKFYVSLKTVLQPEDDYEATRASLRRRIDKIMADLGAA